MFDFALGSKKRKGISLTGKQPPELEKSLLEETQEVTEQEPDNFDLKEDGKNLYGKLVHLNILLINCRKH